MVVSYADANKRINKVLELFIVGCASAAALATFYGHPKFVIVLLFMGLIGYAIEAWPSRSPYDGHPDAFGSKTEHVANIDVLESSEGDAFCCKFRRFSLLLAMTVFLIGSLIGNPLLTNCITSVFTWFISMLCVPLLCAPHNVEDE